MWGTQEQLRYIIKKMTRTILHLDLDAFFCAVEELHNPSLRGKPFAVGGRPEERGVVASCSYAARALGVHSAMPMSQALRLCPNLIIVSRSHGRYGEMSEQVMARLRNLSPLVEQISIDEAFVDISDLCMDSKVLSSPQGARLSDSKRQPAQAVEIARKLQKQIMDEVRLPCSIGIASNKLVAKLATDTGKKAARGSPTGTMGDYPNALTVVPSGSESEFLSPLPVSMLWGVGPKTEARLSGLGIHTIGQLAAMAEPDLLALFGENGREMAQHARGLDDRPVVTEHEIKSISQEVTFARDVRDDKVLESTLKELSAEVGKSLRHDNLAGKTVKLKLRWPDFTTLTRQATLPTPTDQDNEIYATALDLLRKVREKGKPVRLIGVGVSNLGEPVRQMELWGHAESEKNRKLRAVLDQLQEKYGKNVVKQGKR